MAKTGPVLAALGIGQDAFKSAFDLHAASAPDADDAPVLDARAVLQRFVASWNAYDRRPPAFVGFALDVEDELGSPDVEVRFENCRYAYGGLFPTETLRCAQQILDPIAQQHDWYRRSSGRHVQLTHTESVTKVREGEYFYPAPTPLPFGRTVNLNGELDETKLTCELIHLPVDLKLEQIVAVGHIDTPIPNETLSRVRDVHLWLLRYETGRDDFGECMSGHEPS